MIVNASFEEPNPEHQQPGMPASWTTEAFSAAEAAAFFDGDLGLEFAGAEMFEHGWTSDDHQRVLTFDDVSRAVTIIERFERNWFARHDFHFLPPTASAGFSGSNTEMFQLAWGLEVLGFQMPATNPGPSERFDGWGHFTAALGASIAATFDARGLSASASTSSHAEQFKLREPQRVLPRTDSSFNQVDSLSVAVGDAVTFRAELGSLPAPLVEHDTYFVLGTGFAANRFFIGRTPESATLISLTDTGSGRLFVASDPGRCWLITL